MLTSFLTKACLYCVIITISLASCRAEEDGYYVAAVLEHAPFYDWKSSPDFIIHSNLVTYTKAVEIASSKKAHLIVFPEYGIVPPWVSGRDDLKHYAEIVPAYPVISLPCEENDKYIRYSILHRLSCMARNNSITIVANLIEIEYCEGEIECPPDNFFLFNTNVVFDELGVVVLRHRKSHLLYEDDLDLPYGFRETLFQTKYGNFSTAICYELEFQDIGIISQDNKVDGVAFSAQWIDTPPQDTSLQYFESWAIGQNLTLLAANLNIPGSSAVGSGIFNGQNGALAYTYNPDGVSKLIVATVPKFGFPLKSPEFSIIAITQNKTWEWQNDGKDVEDECSELLLGESDDYRCQQEDVDDYNFEPLTNSSGTVESCHNDLCCSVSYVANSLEENFFLGAYSGLENVQNDSLCEEICILTACEPFGNKTCNVFPRKTITLFMKIEMKASFTSEVVYPSLLGSGMRLIPRTEWNGTCNVNTSSSELCLNFENKSGRNIIAAGMRSRCYERDDISSDHIAVSSGNHIRLDISSFVMAFISTLFAYMLKKCF